MPKHNEQCKMDENNFKVFIENQLLAITFFASIFKTVFLFAGKCTNMKTRKNVSKKIASIGM